MNFTLKKIHLCVDWSRDRLTLCLFLLVMLPISSGPLTRLDKRGWSVSSNIHASEEGPYRVDFLLDNNLNSIFVSANNAHKNWIQVDFGKTINVRSTQLSYCTACRSLKNITTSPGHKESEPLHALWVLLPRQVWQVWDPSGEHTRQRVGQQVDQV